MGELHAENCQRLADIIVREMGKPISQAIAEVEFCTAIYDFYADNAEELMADVPIKLLADETAVELYRRVPASRHAPSPPTRRRQATRSSARSAACASLRAMTSSA